MNATEEFIELYKKLEAIAVRRYNYPKAYAITSLEQRPEFRQIADDLDYCRKVRNHLQHESKVFDTFSVVPSESMLRLMRETLEKVQKPPKANNVAIPISSVYYQTMDDYVKPAMVEMQRRVFTHIPILENRVVVGVFSENTVFSYLIDEEIISIDDNMKFSDLKEYLPIDKHRSESFRFVPQDMIAYEVGQMFEQALQNQDRIGLIFTTKAGRPDEPLMGIISAWDVAGR